MSLFTVIKEMAFAADIGRHQYSERIIDFRQQIQRVDCLASINYRIPVIR